MNNEANRCLKPLDIGIIKIATWSPRGTYITQVSVLPDQATQTGGTAEVTVYDSHTNNILTRIATTVPFEIVRGDVYSWTEDESSLFIIDSDNQQTRIYSPDENDIQILPIFPRSIAPDSSMFVDWKGQLIPMTNHFDTYPLVLPCPTAMIANFLWSPNSASLAYTSRCHDSEALNLYVIESKTGKLITQVILPTDNSEPVSWTSDEQILIRSGTSSYIADFSIWEISLLQDAKPELVFDSAFLLGLISSPPESLNDVIETED